MSKNDLENVRQAIIDYSGESVMQLFVCRNIVGDPMVNIYTGANGVTLDYCENYGYFELFGATDKDLEQLKDIVLVEV